MTKDAKIKYIVTHIKTTKLFPVYPVESHLEPCQASKKDLFCEDGQ